MNLILNYVENNYQIKDGFICSNGDYIYGNKLIYDLIKIFSLSHKECLDYVIKWLGSKEINNVNRFFSKYDVEFNGKNIDCFFPISSFNVSINNYKYPDFMDNILIYGTTKHEITLTSNCEFNDLRMLHDVIDKLDNVVFEMIIREFGSNRLHYFNNCSSVTFSIGRYPIGNSGITFTITGDKV